MNIIERLGSLGFTINEAKAYTALLRCEPASAYEIAKQAGLPTSKIYETVSRLVERGVLLPDEDDAGQLRYHAMPPADLMSSIRNRAISETERLLPELQKVGSSTPSNLIWPLQDEAQVKSRALNLITNASHTLLVSAWPEELQWSSLALKAAEARNVAVALVHFGQPKVSIGATYHHPAEQTLYAEKGGRGLTMVADGEEVVIANFQEDLSVDGAWSRNASFVTVAEDYVKHDVYITKVTRFLGSAVTERFGEDYSRLRDVFNPDA